MKCGSLFSGIGGIELGLINSGLVSEVAWQIENDPYCCEILEKNYPNSSVINCNVEEIDPKDLDPIDILTAGFPCQPVSVAGVRKGMEDERWLFDEVIRFISILRPRIFILENVPGLLTANKGAAFGNVLNQIATLRSYDFEWQIISARSIGAAHLRERFFGVGILANSNDEGVWTRSNRNDPSIEIKSGRRNDDGRTSNANVRRKQSSTGEDQGMEIREEDQGTNRKETSELWLGRTSHGLPRFMDRLGMKNAWQFNYNQWPTPTATQIERSNLVVSEKNPSRFVHKNGKEYPMNITERVLTVEDQRVNSWPTPTTNDTEHPEAVVNEFGRRPSKQGIDPRGYSLNVADKVHHLGSNMKFDTWELGMPRTGENHKQRSKQLKAFGNAVVPQQVELVGRMILRSLRSEDPNTPVFDHAMLEEE